MHWPRVGYDNRARWFDAALAGCRDRRSPAIFCPASFFLFLTACSRPYALRFIQKSKWPWADFLNIYHDKHRAWAYSLYAAIVLIVWTAAQLFLTNYFWRQPAVIGLAALILIFTLLPRVVPYCSLSA